MEEIKALQWLLWKNLPNHIRVMMVRSARRQENSPQRMMAVLKDSAMVEDILKEVASARIVMDESHFIPTW